jgi:hypothetical protein
MNRRAALFRLSTLAAGAVALLALPEPVRAAPVAVAPPANVEVYGGRIDTFLSDEPGFEIDLGSTLVALFIRHDGWKTPVRLWINTRLVPAEHRPPVERWARRDLGAGEIIGILETSDPAWREVVG